MNIPSQKNPKGMTNVTNSNIGATVRFGEYQATNTKKIQWKILDYNPKNETVLLLSNSSIYIENFFDKPDQVDWKKSDVRKLLNGYFLKTCFKNKEKYIISTTVINDEKNCYGISGGENTNDKVFLLSLYEYNKYINFIKDDVATIDLGVKKDAKTNFFIAEDEQKKLNRLYNEQCIKEIQNNRNKINLNENEDTVEIKDFDIVPISSFYNDIGWWLRTPGISKSEIMFITKTSGYNQHGISGFFAANGVRPAMWVKAKHFDLDLDLLKLYSNNKDTSNQVNKHSDRNIEKSNKTVLSQKVISQIKINEDEKNENTMMNEAKIDTTTKPSKEEYRKILKNAKISSHSQNVSSLGETQITKKQGLRMNEM